MNDTSTGTALANAGVRFPPPLIYLLTLVAAYFVNRLVPLWLVTPEPHWMWNAGRAAAVLGVLLAFSGIITFRRHQTAIIPHHPARTVVTSGPYAFTRNPMYVGMGLLELGVALLLDSWWAVCAVPVALLIVNRAVIPREERYLASEFGEEYERYRGRVRRWI